MQGPREGRSAFSVVAGRIARCTGVGPSWHGEFISAGLS